MIDETIPFPAAEEVDKKPRRRRGGARRRKSRPAEESSSAEHRPREHHAPHAPKEPAALAAKPAAVPPAAVPAAPVLAGPAAAPAAFSVGSGPPLRAAVEQRLSLFIDFENIALGVRDAQYKKFDINLVLQRLIEKGRIVYKKAYADWTRYSDYKREFHEAAIELIDIPQRSYTGKNSAEPARTRRTSAWSWTPWISRPPRPTSRPS
jgi:hypothetical protein